MDLTSESMYDTFKDEIWRELGPLDPDWFDVLTAQAVSTEGNVSDQDDLCANQEGNFKTPFDETAVESQLFSTPKVFRRCRVVSPETKDEQSFTAEPEKETLPWTTTSPYFIQISKEQMPGTKYGGIQPQESFDLLHTPQKSPVSYAKQISESLGAHIHPDISWTSSLNTPPAVPSTLILSKTEESPCPVSFSEDKSVVFVRKLFPSLSNASQVGSVSPKNNDLLPPTIQDGAGSPEAGQNPESHNSPSQSSLNQSGVWRQKQPDAIEDGEIRSTVASVLDGAENVLSIFFSNSSSALRKVKTDRMKRKQIISAKEHGCSSTHISTKNMATSSEQRTADRQLCRVLSSPHLKSPVRTGDMGTTQWSPLSLSEILPSTVVTSCHNNNPAAQVENNCLTEQLQSDSGSSQLVRPSLKITDSGFIKKKRHFIYTVETSKPQVQERETHSQKIDSSPVQELNVKHLPNARDEADNSTKTFHGKNEIRQRENVTEENLPPSVQAKVQDVDMSQLCRAFAQDFSQMSDPVRLSEAAEATPQNGFSPSVCLSALKRAKHKARQASLQHDHDGVSNRRRVFAANQNNSIIERTICDSGFQSAVADITHLTAFSALPSSEKESQTQQWTTPFQSPNKENRKAHLEDTLYGAETDAKLSFIVKENQTLDPGRESEVQTKTTLTHPSSSAKGAVDNINCIPVSGQVHGSLPEKTIVSLPSVHASGFKTASNKGIRISSANLERAKRLFEQTEGEGLNDQPTKCGHDTKDDIKMSHGSVKTTASDSNHPSSSSEKFRDISCQLTASQKADVTELCTLLEETDSQFEFTELKTATLNQQCQDNATSPQKAVKELDPDFLTGIDFDDSFSLDAEKHVAVTMMPGKMALVSDKTYDVTSKPTEMSYSSGLKKENFSTGTVPSSSKHIAEGRNCVMSSENLDRAEYNEISKPSNKNPLTLSVGFKTAGGNVLRVSKKCLSNARALFADLEESLVTEKNSPDKKNGENYTKTVHKDSVDNNTDKFLHHKEDNSKFTSYSNDTEKRIQSCFSNMKESVCSDRQVSGMRDEGATTSFANSKMDIAACQSGFQMASGRGISISAKAMQKANSVFRDCDVVDSNDGMSEKHNNLETLPGSFNHKKNLSKFKSVHGIKANVSEEPVKRRTEFENVNSEPSARRTEVLQHDMEIDNFGVNNTPALIKSAPFLGNQCSTEKPFSSPLCTTSKNISSSAINDLSDGGFCTASGKKVSVSADAMTKAACLLNEIQTHEDTDQQMKEKQNSSRIGLTNQSSGFQTAGGKGVVISSAALKKAKSLLTEYDGAEDKVSVYPKHSKIAVHGPTSRNSGFLAASGKPVAFSSEALKKAKTLFDDISFSSEIPAVSATRKTDQKQENAQNKDKMHCGFSTAVGTVVHVSQQNLSKAKNLFKEFDDDSISVEAMQEADAFFKDCDVKDTNVSDDAMIKAKSLLSESATFEDTNKQLKQKEDTPQNVGFQTASGKGVAISSAALKKAKSLLSECEDIADKSSAKPTHSKMPFPGPTSRNSGFLAASGKPVAFSSEALQKAKTLFDDISLNTDIPAVSSTRENKKQENAQNKEKMHCGFSTAGGAKVRVSQQNLLKAKNLFKEFDDDSVSLKAMQEADAFFKDCDIKDSNVSDDAMIKAKSVLSESATFEDTNKQLKQKEDTPQNVGFQTASGKGVAISSAALKKAKSLLSECEDFADKSSAKPTHSKMPFPDPPPRNSGFLAASGKPVAFSSEALKKAKALFDDISFSSEIPAVSDTRKNDKKQENAQNIEKIHCGFSTSGGAIVRVSQQNLLKAKNLLKEFDDDSVSLKTMREADAFFKDCDVKDSNDEMSVKPQKSSENVNKKKILPTFKNVQGVTVNFSEEPVSGRTEFENVKAGPDVHHEKMLRHNDVEIQKDVKNPLALTDALFLHANQFLKPLSSPLCTTAKKLGYSAVDELSSGLGFCTASGKKVSVSDDAMAKAKSLLSESATFEDTNKQLKQKEDTPQNVGFQTADGKGVAISCAALKKAKSLLSECEDVANKSSAKPTHFKMPYPGPPPRNSGFLAASGKPVAFSSEALQKAKALFDDISLNTDVPAVSDTWKNDKKHEDAQNNKEKIHCGFTTAGGAKVQVSQINLLKAKNLLREFDNDSVSVKDGREFADSSSYSTSLIATHKSDLSKDVKRTSNSNLVTTSDKDMPAEESALQVVKPQFSSRETDSENKIFQNSSVQGSNFIKEKALTDAFKFEEDKFAPSGVRNLHREKRPNMLDHEINQTSSNEKLEFTRTEESSVLRFQSLNFSGCTETQQKLFAQEALDCTKALLEDEGLAGQSLSMTFENMPLQENPKSSNRSVEEQKTTGKRLAEDADMTGQPPLKRRLLDEFDRTLDSPRQSTLQPERSCATGVMKDRRVFKYSVSLHPNITRPHSDGKNYMVTRMQKETQHSAPGDSKSAHSKIPAFVPPFLKNSKTETHKNNMVKDNRRTPSAFVPPFKKQRTIVQESCSKPHEEEDKHHHLSAMPSNSSTFVPPTKKTSRQSTTDVTGNKRREDIHPVALVGNTKDDHVENHKIPVGCGTEDSAAEASGVVDTLSRSQEIQTLENIELARDMQDMRIRKKKRQTIRPLPGSLFLTKTSGVSRIPLKDAVNGKPPAKYTQKQLYGYGVHQHVSEITGDNAQSFRFSLQQFLKQEAFINEGGVQLADGGWLIPSKNGTAGKEEFYRALCDTPGVDPKLISEEWVYNHYRWIVWKQASMERSFPGTMGSLCLTPEQVLLQLKYRYDVEVDHSRRPALRKIMEKDDTAAKTLVLCVCGVVSRGHSPTRQSRNDAKTPQGADAKAEKPCAVVWLTDGWYAIKAQLDDPLTAMLHKGPLAVGGKLIIHGAQLVGSQDACSPLEAPESLMLKIYANSSRPARWDTKLGFYRDPRPFLLPLSCLYSNGGPVGCVDMVILRSYPIQWMERKPDGGVVFRSVRAEEKEVRRYNSNKQKAMEIVFAKIQAEFEKEEKGNNKPQRRRRTISRQDIASLQDGEELYEAVGDDPAYLEAHLSEQQLETLHTYRHSLMERKQAELQDRYRRALENAEDNEGSCPKRDVTPVWRLCIADSMNQSSSVYQLNMWRPSSDLQSMLKEGCRYKVYNLTTSDGKKRSGIETVQLTGNKKTQFQDLKASQEWLSACFQPRVSATFVDLQNPEFQPLCGEVDLTGYVITIIDGQGSSPAFYMVDGKLNFVKVRCFSSLAQSGLEDVVKPRELLALSNLQLRGQSPFPTPVVYAGDLTIASTNPKETHLQESLGQLRNLVQGQENFFLTAEEKLSYLIKSVGMSSISSPALQPKTPAVPQQTTADRRQDTKTSVTSQQPIRSLGSFTPVSRNPPPGNCSTEKDPKSLKRRRALDYLSRIPSPPPVPLLGSAASPCVNKTFNPPRRSGTPSTLKTVQTPARRPVVSPAEDEWVKDEELAMIDTQALHVGT